jgi:hypothetical protein
MQERSNSQSDIKIFSLKLGDVKLIFLDNQHHRPPKRSCDLLREHHPNVFLIGGIFAFGVFLLLILHHHTLDRCVWTEQQPHHCPTSNRIFSLHQTQVQYVSGDCNICPLNEPTRICNVNWSKRAFPLDIDRLQQMTLNWSLSRERESLSSEHDMRGYVSLIYRVETNITTIDGHVMVEDECWFSMQLPTFRRLYARPRGQGTRIEKCRWQGTVTRRHGWYCFADGRYSRRTKCVSAATYHANDYSFQEYAHCCTQTKLH